MDKETIIKIFNKEIVVKFSYYKADGSVRQALGTLEGNIIDRLEPEKEKDPVKKYKMSSRRAASDRNVPYFDIKSRGWRSFDISRLIGFDEKYQ